jgi:alkylhydroperoxidase family enzyme
MAYIRTISESDATGDLAGLYSTLVDPSHGGVDSILKIHSLNAEGLKAHLAVYRAAMTGTKTLRKVERELIAVVVSKINACHY